MWRSNRKASIVDEETFFQAINTYEIVTRADPNTASHLQRMLRNAALYQMAKDDPAAFDVTQVRTVCIRGIGFSHPEQFLSQAPVQGPPPDPKAQAAMLSAQADMMDSQTKAQELQHTIQNSGVEDQNRDQDRTAKLAVANAGIQKEKIVAAAQLDHDKVAGSQKILSDQIKGHLDRQRDAQQQAADQAHEMRSQASQQIHEQTMQSGQQLHEARTQAMGQTHEAGLQGQQQQHDMANQGADRQMQMGMAAMKPPAMPGRSGKAAGGPVKSPRFLKTPYGIARRAPDGKHYVKHPKTGQYFRIERR
jgi:hypothetical protein